MTGFLLDSDWAIDYLANRSAAVTLINSLINENVSMSIISIAELLDGVAQTSDPPEATRRLTQVLEPFETLPIDFETARIFGEMRSELRQTGMSLADFDLLIAATALRHDLTLVTRNRRHFDRIPGLRLYEIETSPT